ncbi:hypothetical protein F2S72_09065 [Pseudomonas syringae pv. actinidiae]|nr:hypothetical protein [Pseudomonas syringae pv. actinidiae]
MGNINRAGYALAGVITGTFLYRVSASGVTSMTIGDWMLPIASVAIAAAIYTTSHRAADMRVELDVRPNEISVQGGKVFPSAFSQNGRFVVDTALLDGACSEVAARSDTKGKLLALKETAHVRIWPGETGITPLELEAVTYAFSLHFVNTQFEVMEGGILATTLNTVATSQTVSGGNAVSALTTVAQTHTEAGQILRS